MVQQARLRKVALRLHPCERASSHGGLWRLLFVEESCLVTPFDTVWRAT